MLRHWLATALYRAHDKLKWLAEWCFDCAVYTAHRDSWSSIRARRRYAKLKAEQPMLSTYIYGPDSPPVGGNPIGWAAGRTEFSTDGGSDGKAEEEQRRRD